MWASDPESFRYSPSGHMGHRQIRNKHIYRAEIVSAPVQRIQPVERFDHPITFTPKIRCDGVAKPLIGLQPKEWSSVLSSDGFMSLRRSWQKAMSDRASVSEKQLGSVRWVVEC